MLKYAEMLKKADPPNKGVNSSQYRETGKDPLLAAKPEGAGKFDEGDWGYAALGAGLGGGAAWLLGRLIHGDKFRKRKWLQLLYALGGAGLGGAGGLMQGRDIVKALTADAGEKGEWDPKSRTYKPKGWKDKQEHDKKMWLYRGTGALGGGAAGVIGGAKAGGSYFNGVKGDAQVRQAVKGRRDLLELFRGKPGSRLNKKFWGVLKYKQNPITWKAYTDIISSKPGLSARTNRIISQGDLDNLVKAVNAQDMGKARLKYQGIGAAAGGIGGALGGGALGEMLGRLMIGKGKQLEG